MRSDEQFLEYFRRYAAVSLGPEPEKLAEFYDQRHAGDRAMGGDIPENGRGTDSVQHLLSSP